MLGLCGSILSVPLFLNSFRRPKYQHILWVQFLGNITQRLIIPFATFAGRPFSGFLAFVVHRPLVFLRTFLAAYLFCSPAGTCPSFL